MNGIVGAETIGVTNRNSSTQTLVSVAPGFLNLFFVYDSDNKRVSGPTNRSERMFRLGREMWLRDTHPIVSLNNAGP